ncbi:MAG: hypothetical protein F6K23_12535 [Okeania sp. SIO2C9]|uniref:hypothetical protein n=1 Tax=Okeania sp. SIO2C9 TaxID=2607791 RepID=UPI0013C17A54|nr:hypothetical protein [Okeania sp. SIO2C9]NEQ73801.1 hypothetical protein [Okeania sp. SIO2C9]
MNNLKYEAQFAVCIKNKDYPASLELYKIYVALTDEEAIKDGDLRIVDESGEDYLEPADYFVIIELPKVVQDAVLAIV